MLTSLGLGNCLDEERNAEIEKHKQDSVEKAKEGKGEWKGELASNSEAAVSWFFFFPLSVPGVVIGCFC